MMGPPIKRGKPAKGGGGGGGSGSDRGKKPAGGGKGGGKAGGAAPEGRSRRRKSGPNENDVYEIDEDLEAGGERRKKHDLKR